MYIAFADDSTFILNNDLLSVKNLVNTFKVFSHFSGLKTNLNKCEIAGLGSLKGVLEAVCGLKSIKLTTDTVKILGAHFSHNDTLKLRNDFLDTVRGTEQVPRFWNSRMLFLEGRIIIFKTFAIFKIVYLAFVTVIPNSLIEELEKIQNRLYDTAYVQKLVTKDNGG